MVQTFHIMGIASARTTAISIGTYIGRDRIGVVTALRMLTRRSYALAAHSHALSGHALAAHSHALSGHALATHSHDAFTVRASNIAFATPQVLMLSAGNIVTSGAHGALPHTELVTGGTPAGGIDGVVAGTPAGGINGVTGGIVLGTTSLAYVIDSNGRYVLPATHPAAGHAVLKPHGNAGPRIELGDAVRAGDIIEITTLMQRESGGIF